MGILNEILTIYQNESASSSDQGNKFERLMRAYFTTAPEYAHFSNVWLWSDFPENRGEPDTGIDLVAKDERSGGYCAIQCKAYTESSTLYKKDIDSFFTASGKKGFTSRIIVCTTDKISSNVVSAMKDQQVEVTCMGLSDLENSAIDWQQFDPINPDILTLKPQKMLREHQQAALNNICTGFNDADRGKLIMACGTGKTFTSLKIAEKMTPSNGMVLFMVPSLALMSQSLKDWAGDAKRSISCFAVCSDHKVGKMGDQSDIYRHEVPVPVTTNSKKLAEMVENERKTVHAAEHMTVIFSTYQSIAAVKEAQDHGLGTFDLIICDEAHRTTGVRWNSKDQDDSKFIRIHDENYIKGVKRLYMTATPRIYSEAAKGKAKDDQRDVELCSMDDERLYGRELHRLDFAEAVEKELLSDYKVVVLTVHEDHMSQLMQGVLSDETGKLNLQSTAQIVGAWNALGKNFQWEGAAPQNLQPMKRAVAFCQNIKASKDLKDQFNLAINEYVKNSEQENLLQCELDHVDGSMNALQKNKRLDWLKEDTEDGTCRILSNARCLSEGVDVPNLDGVIFFHPKGSVVDIVQAVGRVMRKAEGKEYGYIILPVTVSSYVKPEDALDKQADFKVVWQVLRALRAHDSRIVDDLNRVELKEPAQNIIVTPPMDPGGDGRITEPEHKKAIQLAFSFEEFDQLKDVIYAKMVKKCGARNYWEDWAKDIEQIAKRHISRIEGVLAHSTDAQIAFDGYIEGLHKNINCSIGRDDAVEMLAQHIITRPVFNAIFDDYDFSANNPVSKAMQSIVEILDDHAIENEGEKLEKFYESVKKRVSGYQTLEAKQRAIVELYDKFFKTAFPKTAERLGIVYTPLEVVDFIIHSVEHVLKDHFASSLNDQQVQVLDPFTGTGTFMVRLLQSGIIRPENLPYKYRHELFANEIVLLAYYIAAVNMESAYHHIAGDKGSYEPFNGIALTDTFNLGEQDGDMLHKAFPVNSARVEQQRKTPIKVIMGNPPYSSGQNSENDNNKNLSYPKLNNRIAQSYAKYSTATNKNSLYDSYIQATRWATDRIGDEGIIAYVSNGSFIDGNAADGLRKCLMDEFSHIYCFNLRGNQRTSGERSRKEGGKIFDAGSRTPVAITFFIKQNNHQGSCQLHYHDIGDYLDRKTKLAMIENFHDISHIPWQQIMPNAQHDWINQRNDQEYETYPMLGNKDKKTKTGKEIFINYSMGLRTNRDAWAYNFSDLHLADNMKKMIDCYNQQVRLFTQKQTANPSVKLEDVITSDPTQISWSANVKSNATKGHIKIFDHSYIRTSLYRPFCKQYLYYGRDFNERVYQIPQIFPEKGMKNLAISTSGKGAQEFSALMIDLIPEHSVIATGQAFPLYTYEKIESDGFKDDLFADQSGEEVQGYRRKENISDYTLGEYRRIYQDDTINKQDIFYYIYGVLHHKDYKARYAHNLSREIPRIPYIKEFWDFSTAGQQLASLHLNYEQQQPYPLNEQANRNQDQDDHDLYYVQKMRFPRKVDKTTIAYNAQVTLSGIPERAYEYVVNGKSAIEWMMDRYQVKVDKASKIKNDPNLYSENPRYIIDLLKRVVAVSINTVNIIEKLPPFEIINADKSIRQEQESLIH